MTDGFRYSEVLRFGAWFSSLPHKHKVLVVGNHDRLFEHDREGCLHYFKGVHYLENSGVVIDGVNFWGSPITPFFCNWAFNERRGERIKRYWDAIPADTDVLITHGPPEGIWDSGFGCSDLRARVDDIRPELHIFGHSHCSGTTFRGTTFINVSVCNELYRVVYEPRVIDL